MTGSFIAFCGPNGVGKSSTMRAVAEAIKQDGRSITVTREPGGTPFAEEMRAILLDPKHDIDPTTQLLLFNAARRSHLQEIIFPAKDRGDIVLCDRFLPSSLVFQSLHSDGSDALPYAVILDAHERYCFNAMPDFTVYLHAPEHIRQDRIAGRAGAPVDRFERYASKFDQAAAERFTECGALLEKPHAYIDASGDPETVVAAALKEVRRHLADERD